VLLKQAWCRLFIFVGINVTKACTCLHSNLICTYDLCTWSLSLPAHKYSCSALKYVWHLPCTLCPSTFVRYGVTICTLFFDGCPVAAQDGGCDKHASSRTVQRSWHVRVCCIDEGHSVIGKDAMCSGSIKKLANLPPPPHLLLWQWATFLWKVCACLPDHTASHNRRQPCS
jgi:hypothetical protein